MVRRPRIVSELARGPGCRPAYRAPRRREVSIAYSTGTTARWSVDGCCGQAVGTISVVARSHESLRLWLGAGFIAVGAALLGVAGGFEAASKVRYSFLTSVPAVVAWVMFALSLACFICAIRDVPILYLTRRTDRQSERRLVFALLTFLDGRRVLFDPWTLEEPELVANSILMVRARIDDDLASLEPDAEAVASLRTIRTACLRYLTRVPHPEDASKHWPDAINDLRAGVAEGIESLERDYKIAMPGGTGREQFGTIYLPGPEGRD